MRSYLGKLNKLPKNGIFVFGSNIEGRHGKGSAKVAKDKFGAIYGVASGLQGQSYAIYTKDLRERKHPSIQKEVIQAQIAMLYEFADNHPELDFYIAYSGEGTNLNGYSPDEMVWMFAHPLGYKKHYIPENIIFEINFYIKIKNLTNSLGRLI